MRRTHARVALALASALLLGPGAARAYFEETTIGARGLSLGTAVSANVQDVTALYWNPAGLAELGGAEGVADYARPYGLDNLSEGSLAVGFRRWNTGWAIGWHHLGLTEVYAEDLLLVAAGRALPELAGGHRVAAGATFKLGRAGFQPFRVDPEAAVIGDPAAGGEVDYGAQSKGSLDLGLLWHTPWRVDVAWVGRDLLQPTYRFVPGSGGGRIPFRQEVSAALHWNRESTLTGGWAQTPRGETSLNLGLEILFYDVLAIRSGLFNLSPIYQANGNPEKFQFTGGFGIFHKGYRVDATAFSNHDLGASYRVTLIVPIVRGDRP